MIRKLFVFSLVLSVFFFFNSCNRESENLDKTLLYGKWKSGDLYYRYDSNGWGATWDESEDVREDEAQRYRWTLSKAELMQMHELEMAGSFDIPKYYTITELTASTLRYKDDFRSFSFTKVQ